jgi:coenzyme Q-binding protein COQ10
LEPFIVKLLDQQVMRAPAQLCFRVAADVERWPAILEHYRWVRFRQQLGFGTGLVEMAAWRRFPLGLRYPTWWMSEMRVDEKEPAVYYEHVRGITRGMTVKWSFLRNSDSSTLVHITHDWSGPRWPLIGPLAASWVIGPHFISAIAQRTLAGVAREAERQAVKAATLKS